MGGYQSSKNIIGLEERNINHIVFCVKEIANFPFPDVSTGAESITYFFKKFQYKRIAVMDTEDENIAQYFEETNEFIHNCILEKKPVLVHW